MNAALAAGERAREVRRAARAWEQAGWIDAAHRARIDGLHADDRVRLGWALRALVFLFTCFAVASGFGVLMVPLGASLGRQIGIPLLLVGGLCLVGAEVVHSALRASGMGADDALEQCALGFGIGGAGILFALDRAAMLPLFFACAALVLAAAAWRWGGWFYGLLSSAALFAALWRAPAPRVAWVVVGAALILPLLRLGDSASLSPSQRAASRAAAALALAAPYIALNYASLDRGLLEERWLLGEASAPDWVLPVGLLATIVLPPLVLWLGVRRRDRLVLACGLLMAAASLATLRWYVHLMPLWLLLMLAGAALGGAALALRRWLDAGAEHVRGGFTAEPLLESGRRQLLEIAASVAVFTPAAQPTGAETSPGFSGGGGQSGGGGATTTF